MADVSVEFGAKDTGLEQTLKTVQDELTRLNEEVASGELSFKELQSTMKQVAQAEKLEQQLQAIADETRGAGDAASDAAPEIDDAGESMDEMGDSATGAGEKSEMGFAQMAAAVAAGQAAVELAMGAIKGAIDAVTGTFGKFGEALDKGAELDILSSRTGVASGELARLGRALENTGASADMLGPIFDRMNRTLAAGGEEGSKASEALAKLGLNIDELKAMSPERQFEKIGTALSGVADRSERVDMAMDIFGRGSGSRLLRLFEDYQGTMAQVDRQLGIFPSIMNEMSKSFEAASTEINAAKEKVVEFATGIMSRVMPAIEAIATGLASIDAAALGQKLADAFIGGTKAMEGFQAALDAIKLGEFGKAFELIFESIKLQVMQTGDEIYKNFKAAFEAAVDFIKTIFAPGSMLMTYIDGAFTMLALKVAGSFAENFASALPDNFIFGDLKKGMQDFAATAKEDSEMLFGAMYHDAGFLKDELARAGAALPDKFKEKYAEAKGIFSDIETQQAKVKGLQDEITAAVEKTNAEKEKGIEIGEKEIENAKERLEAEEAGRRGADSPAAGGGGGGGGRPAPSRGEGMVGQMRGQLAETALLKKVDPGMFAKGFRSSFEEFGKALSEGRTGAAEKELRNIESRMQRAERDQRIAEKMGKESMPNFGELRKEAEQLNRELKGGKEELGDWSKIAGMGSEELKNFVDSLQQQTEALEPEGAPAPGSPGAMPEKPEGKSAMDTLSTAVEAIRTAIEKIELKLPQQALA